MRSWSGLLSLILAPASAGAQVPDTSDWRSYFPLEVGNAWQYHVTDDLGSGYYGYQVTHDTTIEAREYVAVRYCNPVMCFDGGPVNPYFELRHDTSHALVVEWIEPTNGPAYDSWWEPVPCALNAPFGSVIECTGPDAQGAVYFVSGGPGFELVLPPDTVRGVVYKQFESIPVVMGVVAGFGVVSRQYAKNPPFPHEQLVYARVGGTEYGTAGFPFPPLVDAGPSPVREGSLSLSPNPARQWILVSVPLDRDGSVRVSVADLLGREMLLVELGNVPRGRRTVPLDIEVLPAGVYAVQVVIGERPIGTALMTVAR